MTHNPEQSADAVRYPCIFPETNHEALMDNLYAVVEQRNDAREQVEALVFILRDLVTDEEIGLDGTGELWLRAKRAVAQHDGSGLCRVAGHVWVDPGRCSRCGLLPTALTDGRIAGSTDG